MSEEIKARYSSFWANLFKPQTERSDLEKILLSFPSFNEFKSRELYPVIKLLHHRIYSPGEFIFYQGDPGIGLYLIKNGEVLIERVIDNDHKLELARFHKGDFFGEIALIESHQKRTASAIASTETECAIIFKPDLEEYLEKFPEKGIRILNGMNKILSSRLHSLNEDYISLYLYKLNKEKENDHGISN